MLKYSQGTGLKPMTEEKAPPPQRERFAAAIARSLGFLKPVHDHYKAADAVLKVMYEPDYEEGQTDV